MGVPLDRIPHTYDTNFDMLKSTLGVEIYGNQTMMLTFPRLLHHGQRS
jgi:hypothetical protein